MGNSFVVGNEVGDEGARRWRYDEANPVKSGCWLARQKEFKAVMQKSICFRDVSFLQKEDVYAVKSHEVKKKRVFQDITKSLNIPAGKRLRP